MVSLPPSGIASRALTARFRIALSSWFGSACERHRPPASTVSTAISSPSVRRSRSDMPRDQPVDVDRLRARAAAGARRRAGVGSARRRAGRRAVALPADRQARGRARPPREHGAAGVSRLPMMMVSRLLKSCATPPVSWPIASIFCAWRSASSTRSRSSIWAMSARFAAASSSVRSPTRASRVSVRSLSAPTRCSRSSSIRLRSVMSRTDPTWPWNSPPSSSRGAPTSIAQAYAPSARRSRYSRSDRLLTDVGGHQRRVGLLAVLGMNHVEPAEARAPAARSGR